MNEIAQRGDPELPVEIIIRFRAYEYVVSGEFLSEISESQMLDDNSARVLTLRFTKDYQAITRRRDLELEAGDHEHTA